MAKPEWQTIKDIFAEALELPSSQRLDNLRARCGDDNELFQEVLSLLNAAEEPDNLIEANAIDLSKKISDEGHDYSERHFGIYRILREVGSGGMGTVFLAERDDGEFTKQVALKIVRHSLADKDILTRFKRERQILAGLNHPNIAALYDGGVSEKGEPYLVMEYVEGESLTDFAANRHLTVNERLQLFLKVCSAVAYAHRCLIVHRDLKPSNILVTNSGEPKLLDFGLAKAFESDGSVTRTRLRAFTPAYASPEQILGKGITTASDVYSLGVVLYELLTGQKPLNLENKSDDEIFRTILTSEPQRPSSIETATVEDVSRNSLKGDLDNIVLVALRREPDRRYRSVEEFADDIERHLSGRPVLARPNTSAYLASKFIRRNKVPMGAAFLIVVSLIIGFGFSLWQANKARHERDRAERRFQDVRALSNSLLFEIAPKIETLQGSTEARELLVKRALEYLDSLASESSDDIGLQVELASAYEKIGELQGHPSKPNLGDLSGALASYEKANAIRLTLPVTIENRRLLAENFRYLSDSRFWQGDTEGSLSALLEAERLYEELTAEQPDSSSLILAYLKIISERSQYHQSNNQYADAIRFAQLAIDRASILDPSARETRELIGVTHADLGNSLSWNGEQVRAEAAMAKAVRDVEQLLAESPDDARTRHLMWRVYMLASGIYEDIHDPTALEYAEKAMATAKRGTEIDPADIQFRHNLARSIYRIGVVSVNLRQTGKAIENLKTAESQFLALVEREPKNRFYRTDLGRIYTRTGLARRQLNDLSGSDESFARSLELWTRVAEADPANKNARREIAMAHRFLAENRVQAGEPARSKVSFAKAFEILNQLRSENALPEGDNKVIGEIEARMAQL